MKSPYERDPNTIIVGEVGSDYGLIYFFNHLLGTKRFITDILSKPLQEGLGMEGL